MNNADEKNTKQTKEQSSIIFISLCVCWRSKHFKLAFFKNVNKKTLPFWIALRVFPLIPLVLSFGSSRKTQQQREQSLNKRCTDEQNSGCARTL